MTFVKILNDENNKLKHTIYNTTDYVYRIDYGSKL